MTRWIGVLIERDIFQSHKEQTENAPEKKMAALNKEVSSLRVWGERWSGEINDPSYQYIPVPRLYEVEGRVVELYLERLWYPVEIANKELWGPADDRISTAFKKMRKVGFSRPSTALCVQALLYLFSKDVGKQYDNKPFEWAGVMFVFRRMWSTTRITYRFEQHEKYGDRKIILDDGSVVYRYGQEQWRQMLIERKIMNKPRK